MPARKIPSDATRVAVFVVVQDSVYSADFSGVLKIESAPASGGPWSPRGLVTFSGATDGAPLQSAAPVDGEFPDDVLTSFAMRQLDSQGIYVQVTPERQYIRASMQIGAGNPGVNTCPAFLVLAAQRLSEDELGMVPTVNGWPGLEA
jgi:hypothetical protein